METASATVSTSPSTALPLISLARASSTASARFCPWPCFHYTPLTSPRRPRSSRRLCVLPCTVVSVPRTWVVASTPRRLVMLSSRSLRGSLRHRSCKKGKGHVR